MSTLASVLGTYAVAMKSECMKALPAASRRALHHAVSTGVLLKVNNLFTFSSSSFFPFFIL